MGDYSDPFMRNNPSNLNNPNNPAVQARTKAQNRANVLQLKLIGQSHPTGLTNNLLKLFEPRPPLEYKPPPEKRKLPPYTGIAQFVSDFAEPGQPQYAPPAQKGETPAQRRARIHQLRLEEGAAKALEEFQKYDPNNDLNVSGDPYKTLFVARLNYETSENRIKREFEAYGPIKRVKLITDKMTNKPKGYAFIEYMHTRDMKAAYKQADGRKVDGKRVLVDVERGRTVPNWRPRRLGGGLGTTRVGGEDVNQKYSGREQSQSGPPRTEETRIRENRHVDRDAEKSRERERDRGREREKSHERSLERPRDRDRDHRDDKHHRDRERNRERERERDHGHGRERDRERPRDRGRDRDRGRGRDPERDRERDHPQKERERGGRERGREYEAGEFAHDHGRSRDREYDYDRVDLRHRDYDQGEVDGDDPAWYEARRVGHEHDRGHYGKYEHHRPDGHADLDADYECMEEDDYPNDHPAGGAPAGGAPVGGAPSGGAPVGGARERSKSRDVEREHRRPERSLSREYDY